MEYQHITAMEEHGLSYSDLPLSIKGKVNNFKAQVKRYGDTPNEQQQIHLEAMSSTIADEIQTWTERDFEDENQQTLNMEKEQLIARAKAVGLPETATEAEIVAEEQKQAAAATAKAELAARAKAVGLADDAPLADIEAAEKAAKEKTPEKKEEKVPEKKEEKPQPKAEESDFVWED